MKNSQTVSAAPKGPSLWKPLAQLAGVMLVSAALGIGIFKLLKAYLARPIPCRECGVMVSKARVVVKKNFEKVLGHDEKHEKWYYCPPHRPEWDYAFDGSFFKGESDRECSATGGGVTNGVTNGVVYWWVTNDVYYMTTNTAFTNVRVKHINY